MGPTYAAAFCIFMYFAAYSKCGLAIGSLATWACTSSGVFLSVLVADRHVPERDATADLREALGSDPVQVLMTAKEHPDKAAEVMASLARPVAADTQQPMTEKVVLACWDGTPCSCCLLCVCVLYTCRYHVCE